MTWLECIKVNCDTINTISSIFTAFGTVIAAIYLANKDNNKPKIKALAGIRSVLNRGKS